MPLATPAIARDLRHTRTITCEAYARGDGLWDIDGWLTDAKTYDVPNKDRGGVPAGEPIHGMGLRLTVDADLIIRDAVAVMNYTPFNVCSNITPSFRGLIGLAIDARFNKAARELLGGTKGCVHLVDLLGPMAAAAREMSALKAA